MRFEISADFEKLVEKTLPKLAPQLFSDDFSLSQMNSKQTQFLSSQVLEISDAFIKNPDIETPWQSEAVALAYLVYFLPYNKIRIQSVLEELLKTSIPEKIDHVVDFGSGPATSALAIHFFSNRLQKNSPKEFNPQKITCIEKYEKPQKLVEEMNPKLDFQLLWSKEISKNLVTNSTLGLFSYSLAELSTEKALDKIRLFDHVLIIEPSTQEKGRRLSHFREKMISEGFTILAPCLHQKRCPLVSESKKDWCHNRILIDRPEWLQKIESFLPMKNENLTFSYLIASRSPELTKKVNGSESHSRFRIVGDLLKEKGKTRVMACRGPERDFLSWLKKEKHKPELSRNDIVEITSEAVLAQDKKGNEVRPGDSYRVL